MTDPRVEPIVALFRWVEWAPSDDLPDEGEVVVRVLGLEPANEEPHDRSAERGQDALGGAA